MIRTKSINIYQIPFDGKVDVRPAPFHFKGFWQRCAVDFALDVGTPILAAEDGTVIGVTDGNGDGHLERKYLNKSNLVTLKHAYGEYSDYVHLNTGILVRPGQKIEKGHLLGYSGLSGFTSYPHLHFALRAYGGILTIPAQFQVNGNTQTLVSPRE